MVCGWCMRGHRTKNCFCCRFHTYPRFPLPYMRGHRTKSCFCYRLHTYPHFPLPCIRGHRTKSCFCCRPHTYPHFSLPCMRGHRTKSCFCHRFYRPYLKLPHNFHCRFPQQTHHLLHSYKVKNQRLILKHKIDVFS